MLHLNNKQTLKNVMYKEKRTGNVVEPYAMNWDPFLEDIAMGDTTRPSFVIAGGGKSVPYDPPKFPMALSKKEREGNRVRLLEKREKEHRERESAMKAKADRIAEARSVKVSQPENVQQDLAPQVLESLALSSLASLSQVDLPLSDVESEEEDEDPPQTLPLVGNNLSVLDELELSELGTPALVVPIPVVQSEVSLSDVSVQVETEVPRFRPRKDVQAVVPPVKTSIQVGTILEMHKLPSGEYIPVTRASVRYFCRTSEDYRLAFNAAGWDIKSLQRKLKSSGVEIAAKIEWRQVLKPVTWNATWEGDAVTGGALDIQYCSDAEMYLQEYLSKVKGFEKADIEVFLQCDLNFREQFLAWLPLETHIPRNILRRLETLSDPKYLPKAVATELREMWTCGQEVNQTSVYETCIALPRFKTLWDRVVACSGDVRKATESFRSSIRAYH